MRKIEKNIVELFNNKTTKTLSNRDKVLEYNYFLWDSLIASIDDNVLTLSSCGWNTATTASRIRAFLEFYYITVKPNEKPHLVSFSTSIGFYTLEVEKKILKNGLIKERLVKKPVNEKDNFKLSFHLQGRRVIPNQ